MAKRPKTPRASKKDDVVERDGLKPNLYHAFRFPRRKDPTYTACQLEDQRGAAFGWEQVLKGEIDIEYARDL